RLVGMLCGIFLHRAHERASVAFEVGVVVAEVWGGVLAIRLACVAGGREAEEVDRGGLGIIHRASASSASKYRSPCPRRCECRRRGGEVPPLRRRRAPVPAT